MLGTLKIGREPGKRRYEDVWDNIVLIPKPGDNLGNYGWVSSWKMYSYRSVWKMLRFRTGGPSGKVYLQIWRPVMTVSSTTYRLVGQTVMR